MLIKVHKDDLENFRQVIGHAAYQGDPRAVYALGVLHSLLGMPAPRLTKVVSQALAAEAANPTMGRAPEIADAPEDVEDEVL